MKDLKVKPGAYIPPSPPPRMPGSWSCVFCDELATVMHRGTTYCRRCYDQKNVQGALIS